jgi:hypothetical protein
MMNAFMVALVILSFFANCGSVSVQTTQPAGTRPTATPIQDVVTLTTEHPTASFKLDPDLLNRSPEILEVPVTKVVNPSASAVDIFVYVSTQAEKNKPEPEKELIGNFSLYPADRPGRFMLSPAAALRKFSETRKGSSADDVRLVFEMKLPPEKKPAPAIEVTIASPNWKSD